MSWFVGYYYTIILAAFLFLNKYLDGLDRSQYETFLIIIFTFFQLAYSRGILTSLADRLERIPLGIFLYSLGGYIKRYNPFAQVKSRTFILIIIFSYGLMLLSNYNLTTLNIENFERQEKIKTFIQGLTTYDNYSIVIILIGLSMFELFSRVHIPNNVIINFLGSATFMTYLIHDNRLFASIWDKSDWITLLYNQPLQFMIKICLWALLTFAIGVLTYCLYLLICKLFAKYKHIFLKQS